VIIQGSLYLPTIGAESLVPAIRNMVIGGMVILVLYFRPRGMVGETRPQLGVARRGGAGGALAPGSHGEADS
jgi:hypothetical protein